MINSLTIEKINVLQAENDRLKMELATRNQMLMDAHFQNKKLSDELLVTQNQYKRVVEQNKELQTLAKQQGDSYEYCIQELEKKFEKVVEMCKDANKYGRKAHLATNILEVLQKHEQV